MSDAAPSSSLSDEIAFIRSMVEEGRQNGNKPGIGLAAGLIWGTASLYVWAAWAKVIDVPGGPGAANWAWPVAVVLFLIAGFPLGMYRRTGNRAIAAAWGGVGISCWVVSAVVGIAAYRTQTWVIFTLEPSIIMALYGGAWLVGAAVLSRRWMTWLGVGCLLSSLGLAYTVGKPVGYLLFALALYAFAGLPGLIGVLRQRSAA